MSDSSPPNSPNAIPDQATSPSPSPSESDPATTRGTIALFAGAVAISLAPVFVRLSDTGPTATAFYRLFLAQPVLWAILTAIQQHRQQPGPSLHPPLRMLPWFALAGLMFALDMGFWHSSIHLTTLANSTLIANSAPFFVILGARLFLGERIPGSFFILFPLALLGMALLVRANLSASGPALLGDGYALVTAFFYGAYQLCVKHLRNGAFHPMSILAWSGISAFVVLLGGALLMGEQLIPASGGTWMALLGLALISHTGGQGLIVYAFGHLPASVASLGLLLQPLLVIVLGWVFHGEAMDGVQLTGAAILLGCLYFSTRQAGSRRQRPPTKGS